MSMQLKMKYTPLYLKDTKQNQNMSMESTNIVADIPGAD